MKATTVFLEKSSEVIWAFSMRYDGLRSLSRRICLLWLRKSKNIFLMCFFFVVRFKTSPTTVELYMLAEMYVKDWHARSIKVFQLKINRNFLLKYMRVNYISDLNYFNNFYSPFLVTFCRTAGGSMLGDVNISAILDSFSVSYDKRVRPNYGGKSNNLLYLIFLLFFLYFLLFFFWVFGNILTGGKIFNLLISQNKIGFNNRSKKRKKSINK